MDAYVLSRGRSGGRSSMMATKIIVGLTSSVATYAALYVFALTDVQFFLVYVLHGVTQLFLLLNVAHDSAHNAVSRNRFVNRTLALVFDVFGISSYMWRILHNGGHHSNINIVRADEDVLARGFLRLSPHVRRNPLHAYQHVYAWLLYGFSNLEYFLVKDFEYFFFSDYPQARRTKHPIGAYAALFGGKLFYFSSMIVLPILLLHRSPLLVIAAFVTGNIVIGLSAQLIFQTTHVISTSYFPKSRDEFDNYVHHILATTADYATESVLALWLFGGLNHHVAHHLRPDVCHTHYPELSKIVKETATEYGVAYRVNATLGQALVLHFRLLKQQGAAAYAAPTA